MLNDLAAIAVECLKHPRRNAVWSPQFGKYVCPELDRLPESALDRRFPERPTINAEFKLVFAAACGGTMLFVSLCVTLALAAGRDPPSLTTEIIRGLFSLAQIGFGAVVGLLGGKRLHAGEGN